jgi:1,2-diacylglycerol 3-alpha-glucosyltransferase
MTASVAPLKMFLPCSGLGRIRRGYESFTQECFAALRDGPGLELRLFKGGGAAGPGEMALWNLPRDSVTARCLGKLSRRGAYFVEQLTFFLSLRKHLAAENPGVVYFSDGNLGNLLWRWRRKKGLRYRLLFSNGGPLSPPFPRWDLVQQVSSVYFDDAKLAGQPDDRQLLLPYGFAIPEKLVPRAPADQAVLRAQLGLPAGRPVLLAVGAINISHKRMDYLIREVAALPAPRPFLIMLGQRDSESAGIGALAAGLLGAENHCIRSVPHEQTGSYYAAANLFALASLHEGLPRVLVEALAHGLPCLAHDYPVAREVLADDGIFGDFRQPGALAALLGPALAAASDENARQTRHRHACARFSWDALRDRYANMISKCAALPLLHP